MTEQSDGSRSVTVTTHVDLRCGHCNATIDAGNRILMHCGHCTWWSCPACRARNSKRAHTHPDHPRKCPAKGLQ